MPAGLLLCLLCFLRVWMHRERFPWKSSSIAGRLLSNVVGSGILLRRSLDNWKLVHVKYRGLIPLFITLLLFLLIFFKSLNFIVSQSLQPRLPLAFTPLTISSVLWWTDPAEHCPSQSPASREGHKMQKPSALFTPKLISFSVSIMLVEVLRKYQPWIWGFFLLSKKAFIWLILIMWFIAGTYSNVPLVKSDPRQPLSYFSQSSTQPNCSSSSFQEYNCFTACRCKIKLRL